jgi:GNAT superfamily N-acetyltransferase
MPMDDLYPTDVAGHLWTWWRGDRWASLPPFAGFRTTTAPTAKILASLTGLAPTEITARIETRHRPYVAWIEQMPVAYGWSASGKATFGAPPVTFEVPTGNRYLMDFATSPDRRGQGIYPRLLQAIVTAETDVDRFWILHRHDNRASARGIEKAGFTCIAAIYFLDSGGLGLVPSDAADCCTAASQVFGLPIVAFKT